MLTLWPDWDGTFESWSKGVSVTNKLEMTLWRLSLHLTNHQSGPQQKICGVILAVHDSGTFCRARSVPRLARALQVRFFLCLLEIERPKEPVRVIYSESVNKRLGLALGTTEGEGPRQQTETFTYNTHFH